MTDHYQSAERWLFKAENQGARGGTETAGSCAVIAQVHATLALAAEDALEPEGEGGDWRFEWEMVARDGNGNAALKHKSTGGRYRIIPEEDL